MSRPLRRLGLILSAVVALSVLSGCASDPRYKEGLSWVLYIEAEKKRLNDAGFPQYSRD